MQNLGIGNFAFLQTVLGWVDALICLYTQLIHVLWVPNTVQIVEVLGGGEDQLSLLSGVIVEAVSKRRCALTASFQIEVHFYRQKAEEWDVMREN